MKFYEFIGRQVNRLAAHEEFARRMNADAKAEIAAWLITAVSDCPGDKPEPEWLKIEPGERAKQVIDEAMEFEECPGILSLRALYARLWPPMAMNSGSGCRYCQGTGFRTVIGEYEISGAYTCTHQPPSEMDRRMGVRMSPTQARTYRAELERAEKLRRGVTQEDVSAAVRANRATGGMATA